MSDKEKANQNVIVNTGNSNVRSGADTPVYRKPIQPPPPKPKPKKTK